MAEPILNSVAAVVETAEAGVYLVHCNITDVDGFSYDAVHCLRPEDNFGLSPVIREWMAENPDFPKTPYTPPTVEELRQNAILSKREFRTNALAQGITTADINAYLASIEDPILQDERTIYWEDVTTVHRLDPFVNELGAFTGKPESVLDTVFYIGV